TENDMNVYYYRKNSAASQMTPSDLNEDTIAQSQYLHIPGITPALSSSCYNTIYAAIDIAKKNDVTVIFDPNLRKKLWPEGVAKRELLNISSLSDIVLPGIDEGRFLFEKESNEELIAQKFYDLGPKCVVLKLGDKGAYYLTEKKSGFSSGFQVKRVIDPIGAGDGFATGFISGLIDECSVEKSVERGN